MNTIDMLKQAIKSEKSGDLRKAIIEYSELKELLNNPPWINIKISRLQDIDRDKAAAIGSAIEKSYIDNEIAEDEDSLHYRPEGVDIDFNYTNKVRRINDYSYIEEKLSTAENKSIENISVIIPVYNRPDHLARTLAALSIQSLDRNSFEVIVVDDGSECSYSKIIQKYEYYLDIRFGRQKRDGYRPGAARNLGARMSKNKILFFLDSDILLPSNFLQIIQQWHGTGEKIVTLGTREFVDANEILDDEILSGQITLDSINRVVAENERFAKCKKNGLTYDWRLDEYSASRNLKDHIFPFKFLGAGHFGVSRDDFLRVGGFDEKFNNWGGEDIELGYRLYNDGFYFIPILEPCDLHQEPPNFVNETNRNAGEIITRELLEKMCPAPLFRSKTFDKFGAAEYIPKVSIYIPAFNAEKTIIRAIDSALNQDFKDLEVCICDDGSKDRTLDVIKDKYKNRVNVRWLRQANGGISKSSNTALSLCRGMYIGQLDADDELLPGTISALVEFFDSTGVGLAYTDYEIVDLKDNIKKNGWSRSKFNKYIQLIGNILCHFRFFRRRSLAQTGWFDETLSSAVDFEFYTRMSEVVITKKFPYPGYRYYLDNDNTSRKGILEQRINHLAVVNKTIARLGLADQWNAVTPNPLKPRVVHIRNATKKYNDKIEWTPIPVDFPYPPLHGVNNDYSFIEKIKNESAKTGIKKLPVSIVIPVYNRYDRLAKTLAGLVHQTYPAHLIEIVITDDGSTDAVIDVVKKYQQYLDIKYVRQEDKGFRVGHARNLGVRSASFECIIGLDCDLIPCRDFVSEFMQYLNVTDQVLCLGQYKFINANHFSDDDFLKNPDLLANLPEIESENKAVRGNTHVSGNVTRDWRLKIYSETNNLKDDIYPHRACAGGQVAFHKSLYNKAGGYDEEFNAWGCEDNEFGYRMYEAGAYLIPVLNAIDYHQEPPGGVNESDRESSWKITRPLLQKKSPPYRGWFGYPWQLSPDDTPKVSIYIPSLNNSKFLVQAVDSCLNQTYKDLEVCVLDTGSTDDTLDVLSLHYSGNPRVRWAYRKCDTVAEARHHTIKMCRGMYIGQLDSDDILLPHAVETLVKELDKSPQASLVYSRYEKIDEDGSIIGLGWDSGEYSRNLLMTNMCAHHFRMFRARAWRIAGGFHKDEISKFTYAEDFLMALRLSLFGEVRSVPQVLYRYRVHDTNITHRHENSQRASFSRAAAQAIIEQMGLQDKVTVITPYPERVGLVGYILNNIDN